jgi:hypothetical protein
VAGRSLDASSSLILAATAYRYGNVSEAARLSELSAGVTPQESGRLEENAAYHELEPLLHTIATDCGELGFPLRLPPQLTERWSQVHAREMARTAIIQYGAEKALGALEKAGIRAIPLKGFYLSSRTYEKKSARGFKDLDLLVERSSLKGLHDALVSAGFNPAPDRPSFVPAPAYTVYSLPVGDKDTVMEIDIHIGMHWPGEYERRTAFRAQDLWTAASPEEVEGMRLWALSPEHLVITTMLDVAVNHRYARLVKFRDVLEITRRVDVDWDTLVSWCRRWEVCSFVGPGLRYLAEIDPSLSIPLNVSSPLLPSYYAMKAFLHALPVALLPDHRSRSFSAANLLFFLLSDTPSQRARGLLNIPRHVFRGRRRF